MVDNVVVEQNEAGLQARASHGVQGQSTIDSHGAIKRPVRTGSRCKIAGDVKKSPEVQMAVRRSVAAWRAGAGGIGVFEPRGGRNGNRGYRKTAVGLQVSSQAKVAVNYDGAPIQNVDID